MSNDGHSPNTLGRYQILRRLGTGGMAEVFLARSRGAEGIEKVLVVKRVLPSFAKSAKFISMFVDEAKVAMRLNHPNIVQVYAFEEGDTEFLLAMEFVDGFDLGRLLLAAKSRGQRLPYELAAYVIMCVARGLDYAHNRHDETGEPMEIVHRDVSPQNVLISYDGVVKATDFGIAKARLVSEKTGVIKGKFGYMSPEQAAGEEVDRRSDVYALGVLLAELLMDRSMYPDLVGLDLLDRVREGKITYPRSVDPDVPPELERVVRRATATDREERFQSARALAGALTQYLHAQMELVDGESLERFIDRVYPRDLTLPDGYPAPLEAVPPRNQDATAAASAETELRERRRVVVLSGQITRDMDRAHLGWSAARVLEDIAYKADAVLSWPEGSEKSRFRYIIGLGKTSLSDPLRAASLSLDVIEAFAGLSADLLVPVNACIGLSRGMVKTVRAPDGRLLRYEPVDNAVEVADRLAGEGQPGEALVSGEVYRMIRRDFGFDADSPSPLLLAPPPDSPDALPEKVRVFRLRGALGREARARESRTIDSGRRFIGREEELRQLETLYQHTVEESRTHMVGVVGELGVGKSALMSEAVKHLIPQPRILHSECTFNTADVPFAIAADLVRDACGIADGVTVETAKTQLASALEKLIEDDSLRQSLLEGLDPLIDPGSHTETVEDAENRGQQIMGSVERLVAALASRGPVVIVADALQWADSATLQLLGRMLHRDYEVPCLVLLGSRPDARTRQLFADVTRIELDELERRERRQLIASRFDGATVSQEVESTIADRAGGNPFFVSELVDVLLEKGVISVRGEAPLTTVVQRPGVPVALPTTLEGVVSARIDDLEDDARLALRWLAAAGPNISAADLSTIAAKPLADALESLAGRGLVKPRSNRGYAFSSAVVREVAYEGTDGLDRCRMHRRLADFLARSEGAAPGRIARHLERAGDPSAAAMAYLSAAEGARRVYSNEEALRFFGHALRLLTSDPVRRFEAHSGRERILRFLGRRTDQATELEAMEALAQEELDAGAVALTLTRLIRFHLDGTQLDEIPELIERALVAARAAGNRGLEIDALRFEAELAQYEDRLDEALVASARALEAAEDHPSLLASRGSVLVQRAILLRRTRKIDEALDAHAQAVVIFRRLGVKRHESVALSALGTTLAGLGSYGDAIDVVRASVQLDRETGDRLRLGRKLSTIGRLYDVLGDAERGLEFTDRALKALELVDDRMGRCEALCNMADIYLDTRGPDAALAPLRLARRVGSRSPGATAMAREQLTRAKVHREAGQPGSAEVEVRAAIDAAEGRALDGLRLAARVELAMILVALDRRDEAASEAAAALDDLRDQVWIERSERLYADLISVFDALGMKLEAEDIASSGRDLVEERAARLEDSHRRASYLATPAVVALRGRGQA